jgi:AcrR family transcriptional regulator
MKSHKPGPQPAHSRAKIAEVAVEIADSDGIDAVSMRGLAAKIGSRATSLYRYVRSKDELLDLMTEAVMGETRFPKRSGRWRTDLRAIAHHTRDTLKRHPWLIGVFGLRMTLGPNNLAAMEATLAALDGHDLDIDDMLTIASTLSTFARGFAAAEIAEQEADARSGLDHEHWMESRARYVEAIRSTGHYPQFMRVVNEAKLPHDPRLRKRRFEAALECVLDGVAARLLRLGPLQKSPSKNKK